jgi:hypothetical protein
VLRDGPRVIDVSRALAAAARGGVFVDAGHFHDGLAHATPGNCCE